MLQLKVFNYRQGCIQKHVPNIVINPEIDTVHGTLHLHSIVYHIGETATPGHYIAAVSNRDNWCLVNDAVINGNVTFKCNPSELWYNI